jgi:hypothetical protein
MVATEILLLLHEKVPAVVESLNVAVGEPLKQRLVVPVIEATAGSVLTVMVLVTNSEAQVPVE